MKRREFLTLLGGTGAAVWPLAARAQRAMPVIGFLHASSPETRTSQVAAFRKGLGEAGYTEGGNVAVEYRWAHDDTNRFADLAAELVNRRVAVIVVPVSTALAQAAKAATSKIPIVFSAGTDAVKAGLIASYNRPGGNATGVSAMVSELGGKRLGLLLELLPQAKRIGLLVNSSNPVSTEISVKDTRAAASVSGVDIEVLNAEQPRDLDAALATLAQKRADGLLVAPNSMFNNRRVQLATLAARHRIPTVAPLRDFAAAGGLMSYGPDDSDRYRMVGVYAGRILKGEKPADMPVQRPTGFQFVINLQTARVLGITVPPTLIARADEVID
jgi:putative ABC transport system substrate-binding protein